MSNQRVASFNDETILALFGAQAAEDEVPERLKSYFLKNKTYERVKANLPLRLVIGHKGIGKSALLKIAYLEDQELGELSLWLQPNDIAGSWSVEGTFVDRVEGIKKNLLGIIADHALNKISIGGKSLEDRPVLVSARQLLAHITNRVSGNSEGLDARIAKNFLNAKMIKIYIDDIDRGWSATKRDIENISALINATRDLTNGEEKNLQFRIGIRACPHLGDSQIG